MIISRAPFRVSFFGGGTDFERWYSDHGSLILSTTIDKYCNIIGRRLPRFFDYTNRISWSMIEQVSSVEDIKHPTVKAYLSFLRESGVEVIHSGDLPARTGLASSSSFAVSLINLLARLNEEQKDAQQLAKESIFLERELMAESGGIQDQIAVSHGGFNKITIKTNGDFDVQPINISANNLEVFQSSLMLFFSGVVRNSYEISKVQNDSISGKQNELQKIADLSVAALDVFEGDFSLKNVGELLNESWDSKKTLAGAVSNSFLDSIYTAAIDAGAVGGKLLGAGGGGFFVFVVPEEYRASVKERLKELLEIPIKIDTKGPMVFEV